MAASSPSEVKANSDAFNGEEDEETEETTPRKIGDGRIRRTEDAIISNGNSNDDDSKKTKKKGKKKKTKYYLRKFACMRSEPDQTNSSFDLEVEVDGERPSPSHLVVMVNGLIGSAQDWKFAAKLLLERYRGETVVHCSESNPSRLTFDGVDVMGHRLAEEVQMVIKRHPTIQKISFVAHSLGGLVARYAIAVLYGCGPTSEPAKLNGDCEAEEPGKHHLEDKRQDKICGLEPVNFITSATPHLGSRGHKQVPVFCGFYTLEKLAVRTSWFLGRTGKHLFLTDSDDGRPPLLLQMVNDTEDLKFISALKSFRRRVAYANKHFDHLVGWGTSSLRRRNELPKREQLSRDENYPHIINREAAEVAFPEQEVSPKHSTERLDTHDMEELMLRSLTRLSWERIDISFRGSTQRCFAHSTIQVKTYCINSDGADVIKHMVDNFIV